MQRVSEQDARIIDRVRARQGGVGRRRAQARRARGAPARGHRASSRAATRRSSTVKDQPGRPARAVRGRARRQAPGARLHARRPPRARGPPRRAREGAGEGPGAARRRSGPVRAGPIRQGSGQHDLAGQRHVHVAVRLCAGAGCTPASTSPRRRARRSAPPTPARVVLAGWTGGYGNYTCISHGGALSTCYGAPVALRHVGRREREPGPGHRLRRQHGPLVRRPPALRGPRQRRRRVDPMGYL